MGVIEVIYQNYMIYTHQAQGSKIFKIHKYALESCGLDFKLLDDYIYPIEIILRR